MLGFVLLGCMLALIVGLILYVVFIILKPQAPQLVEESTNDNNQRANKVLDLLVEELSKTPTQKTKCTVADLAWDSVPDDFVIFDLETTGVQRDEVVDIIEIAALKINKQKYLDTQRVDFFTALVKPWRGGLNPGAMAINKITHQMIDESGREMSVVLAEFLEFVGDRPLIAYNAPFDRWFLKRELSDQGIDKKFSYSCALELARLALPDLENHKLSTVALHLGLDTSASHRALEDCKTTLQVYLWSLTKIQREIESDEAARDIQPIEGLAGKSIVFVGKLRLLTKRNAESLARRAGMIVKTTVSKNVDFVVVGKDAAEKEQRAIELNKQVLNELDFGNLILPLIEQHPKTDGN